MAGLFHSQEFIIDLAHFGASRDHVDDQQSFTEFLQPYAQEIAHIFEADGVDYHHYRVKTAGRSFTSDELQRSVVIEAAWETGEDGSLTVALPSDMHGFVVDKPAARARFLVWDQEGELGTHVPLPTLMAKKKAVGYSIQLDKIVLRDRPSASGARPLTLKWTV